MESIDIPALAWELRQQIIPEHVHNNLSLGPRLAEQIEIKYINKAGLDAYIRLRQNKYQLVITNNYNQEDDKPFEDRKFTVYALAHMLGYLAIYDQYQFNHHQQIADDSYISLDVYNGTQLTYTKMRKQFSHAINQPGLSEVDYHKIHEIETNIQLFALNFLIPERYLQVLLASTTDAEILANEFNVDVEIMNKQLALLNIKD